MIVEIAKDDPRVAGILPKTRDLDETTRLWIGLWHGEVAVVWGLVPGSMLSDEAYVWSLATPVVRRCRKALLREGRAWIEAILKDYPTLVGYCVGTTTLVRHLGARIVLGELTAFVIEA